MNRSHSRIRIKNWDALGQPITLFASGEQGTWYDPSDLTTLFQDSAGTTPVTAVEQPVGLMLDKSKGLVLGSELVTNGSNFTTTTGWSEPRTSSTLSAASGNLRSTADSTATFGASYGISGLTIGKTYKFSMVIARGTLDGTMFVRTDTVMGLFSSTNQITFLNPTDGQTNQYFKATAETMYVGVLATGHTSGGQYFEIASTSVKELPGHHASQPTAASRPILSARVNRYVATSTLATQNITTLAAAYTLSFSGAGTITLSGTATGAFTAGTYSVACTAGTLTSTVSGTVSNADIRVANEAVTAPAYQRVTTATDYDVAGFPYYLRFDGVDDWLSTASIDFTGTDKVSVFAGVRKLSDAGVIIELSANSGASNGTFGVFAGVNSISTRVRGTGESFPMAGGVITPDTSVYALQGDIPAPLARLRRNGAVASSLTSSLGTGTFGNYPLYIGLRGGTSSPFNGHLYGLIIRGALTDDATTVKVENLLAGKTGVQF